jgi:NAD(P)-dependent dehydrogenase (short-subunit alcohol dehydrogenase family)
LDKGGHYIPLSVTLALTLTLTLTLEFDFIMKTNLQSCFYLSTALYPQLKKSGKGTVVNVGSVAGGCGTAIKSGIVYAMTKGEVKCIRVMGQGLGLGLLFRLEKI